MDCLRSFNFQIVQQQNYTAAQGFLGWQIGTQHFWTLAIADPTGSRFDIEGFKNINIYKIELTGDIISYPQIPGSSVIVQNWCLDLIVQGQNSTTAGFVIPSPNPFNMISQPNNPNFRLSKFQNSISFASPIQSAKEIAVRNLIIDGIAEQLLTNGQIGYSINFTVYYKYEGE